MNYVKRAFLSVTRKKGRSIILFAIVLILGNLIAGAISIQEATGNVEKNIKKQLGGTVTVDVDPKAYEEAFNKGENLIVDPLSKEVINQIGSSTYVKNYDYNLEIMGGGKDLKAFKPETDKDSNLMMAGDLEGMEFRLKGIQHEDILDIKTKKAKLLSGRTFTKEEVEKGSPVAVISQKVAEENNLAIGDKITYITNVFNFADSFGKDAEPVATRDVPLEVIGIFEPIELEKKDKDKDTDQNPMSAFMNIQFQNTIYTPNEVVNHELAFQKAELDKIDPELSGPGEPFSPTYVLKNSEDMDKFKADTEPLIPENYKLTASTDQYNSIAGPVKSMSKMAGFVLIAAIGASLLIISLVVLLFLRDRKHEFGIYLSLGEKRQRVLGQVLLEILVISFLAISLAVFSGSYLAKGVSSSMMQSQIEAENKKEAEEASAGSMMSIGVSPTESNLSKEDVTKEYQVKLSGKYVLSFYLIGISTIVIATIVPMTYLIRLNPKKIMM
ncbi:MAG: ABC transporter permease [Vagococcus salmoninarum]|uniref:ABC transporter permease n=1 Tax=Vagococcus salmoninarum TaxID=2739 RepID=UPI003F99537F